MNQKYNIGILAHVDAGKTTITEQLLLKCGEIRRLGSVDEGTAVSDFMEVERRRGISVQNACLSMNYEGQEIHVIDTPGHMDFAGEVVRSLKAVDGVVLVISAVEGVQAQTSAIFKELKEMKLPVVMVVNKVDRAGFAEDRLLQDLRKELSKALVPLQTVKEPCTDRADIEELPYSESIFPVLAEMDEELEEAFLLEEIPEDKVLYEKLKQYARAGEVYPLLYASAKNGKGMDPILKAIVDFLPDSSRRITEELSGVVFQVRHEEKNGKAAYIRLYGGSLKSRDTVPIQGKPEEEWEKITQIRKVQGNRFTDEGVFAAGDIAAVYGLNHVSTGDRIGAFTEDQDDHQRLAKPLLMTQVKPVRTEDEIRLHEALSALSDEDPFLRYERNEMTHEMHLHIMGEIQIEILKEVLSTRFKLDTDFSKPGVIYKETPGKSAIGREAYTMPKPCWAIVDIRIDPLPPGSGLHYESIVPERELAIRYQNHVEISVFKTLLQGVYGWEVTDARVTLVAGNSHQWHTHPLDFFVAAPIAVLRALKFSGSVLLEPYMKVRITAEENLLGKISGQILRMRGTFDTPAMENGHFTLEAIMPLKDCMDYPVAFRSLTSGKGTISMRLDSYKPCEPGFMEVLPRRGVDPLDRSKWILSCRSAMGNGERW